MIYDRELITQAFGRSSGMCECRRIGCQHTGGRCTQPLKERMFRDDDAGGWYVRPINEFGPQKLFNVEAVCPQCHNKVKQVAKTEDKISSDHSETYRI